MAAKKQPNLADLATERPKNVKPFFPTTDKLLEQAKRGKGRKQ
jgi:hypothetical protein